MPRSRFIYRAPDASAPQGEHAMPELVKTQVEPTGTGSDANAAPPPGERSWVLGASGLVRALRERAESAQRVALSRTSDAVSRLQRARASAVRELASAASDRIDVLADRLHRVAGQLKATAAGLNDDDAKRP